MRTAAALLCVGLAAVACTTAADPPRAEPEPSVATSEPRPRRATRGGGDPAGQPRRPRPQPPPRRPCGTSRASSGRARRPVPAYDRAARWVAGRFDLLGYTVRRQRVDVPAGQLVGRAGRGGPVGERDRVAARLHAEQPHLVVGAHLDTVAQAPGAEDNASGVGVMLAAARGGGEPPDPAPGRVRGVRRRGAPGTDRRRPPLRVADLRRGRCRPRQRRAVRGMVSLDRVGVGDVVPVGSAADTDPVQRSLLSAARSLGVPAVADPDQRSSDHWSFVRAGLPGARLGSTPYAGYHSPADVPAVVQPAQLERVGPDRAGVAGPGAASGLTGLSGSRPAQRAQVLPVVPGSPPQRCRRRASPGRSAR